MKKFFERSNNRTNFVASFASRPRAQFAAYGRGYRQAAARLAELLTSATHFADYEAYPVVFLYRHALELYLKSVILAAGELACLNLDDDSAPTLRNHHNLKQLCGEVSNVVAKWFPADEHARASMAQVRAVCEYLGSLDPTSDAYRYPTKKSGDASTDRHQIVNLGDLVVGAEAALDHLDAAETALKCHAERAADARLLMQEIFARLGEGQRPAD